MNEQNLVCAYLCMFTSQCYHDKMKKTTYIEGKEYRYKLCNKKKCPNRSKTSKRIILR